MYKNLWDATKRVTREKYISQTPHIRKKSQINVFNFYFKKLEKKEQTKPKISRKKK